MNLTYLLIDLAALSVPVLFSFHPRIGLHKHWSRLWPAILLSCIPFLVWDIIFTSRQVWGFNSDYLLGFSFFGLPIEEILFFICIPYACLFTYYCFRLYLKSDFQLKYEDFITASVLILSFVLAISFRERQYTCTATAGLAAFLLFLRFIAKVKWLSLFYYSHVLLLIPFFIVNGILTGTGSQEPIVWYNNLEIIGLRILTIPVEDVFYGMLLLLVNTYLFELFLTRSSVKKPAALEAAAMR